MRVSGFVLTAGLAMLASTALVPAQAQMTGTATQVAERTVIVGGAPMYPSKNIIQNAVNSKDHTTLVAAVKAAGLVDTLEGLGPFTVFAPTNAAFDKLPPGTVATLLKPENKPMLTAILTYHVVAGRYTEADLMNMVQAGHGKAMLKTVQGEPLTIAMSGGRLWVEGAKAGKAEITVPDVTQSNGVIQVVNAVLLPQ
ncbi:MAG TPA: fasciclin domain-containing protein [Acetobacteraceae bacterium]|nr:fasciclin domain-containing protein [Acetobacteraceae bacterium]